MKSLRMVVDTLIGDRAKTALNSRLELQVLLAVSTSLLAFCTNFVTLLIGYQVFPSDVYFVACVTLVSFATVPLVYRWGVPRSPRAIEFANNLVPGTLCIGCGYVAVATGGTLTLAAVYASAIPLLSVMICRPALALFWSALMAGFLLISMLQIVPQSEFETPAWLTLAGGITVVIPTFISIFLHRKVWEAALQESADARQQLREQHTHQRSLDKRIAAFERQEGLGLMAGRIAHDLNNLLTAVSASVELCRIANESNRPQEVANSIETIEHAAANAGKLSTQLLDYTGKKHHTMVAVNLSERFATTITLGQAASPQGTQVTYDSTDEVWVQGDPIQLDQVVVNLIRNAAQSYEPSSGTVGISLDVLESESDTVCADGTTLLGGSYARLRVVDAGRGIESSQLDKIFEPFYSDRQSGHGLGLAAVAGIVEAHGGGIVFSSIPGNGTEFQVLLPLASDQMQEASDESAQNLDSLPYEIPGEVGNGIVLVVDDEEPVRDAISKLLVSLGGSVKCAEDGQQALDVLRECKGISAMILDVSMPKMDGYETLSRLRQRDLRLPVLLVSGYARPAGIEAAKDRNTEWLSKPFSAKDLRAWMERAGVAPVQEGARG